MARNLTGLLVVPNPPHLDRGKRMRHLRHNSLILPNTPPTGRTTALSSPLAISLLLPAALIMGLNDMAWSTNDVPAPSRGNTVRHLRHAVPTHADIVFPTPKRYAVIADAEKQNKRLYAKGSLLFQANSWTPIMIIERLAPHGVLIRQTKTDHKAWIPYGHPLPDLPHLTLVEEVTITEMRYAFQFVDDQPDKEPRLHRIEGFRAYMVKEVQKETRSPSHPTLLSPSDSSAPASAPSQDLITKIQVTQLNDHTYEIQKESLEPLANSLRGGLDHLTETFDLSFSVLNSTSVEFSSSLGEATINQEGFTITRFGFTRTAELGLQVGDRILSINEQSVTSPLNAWGIVRMLLSQETNLNQLRVQLIRDDMPLTKTYRLK